jgi:hypothetical protein
MCEKHRHNSDAYVQVGPANAYAGWDMGELRECGLWEAGRRAHKRVCEEDATDCKDSYVCAA